MINHKNVRAFWTWFESVASQLADSNRVNDDIIQALDERLQNLGQYTWELGPGHHEQSCLAISPGGDRLKLSDTRAIVDLAPSLSGWEFYPAKQPREWNLAFKIDDPNFGSLNVDAKTWRGTLLQYDDGYIEFHIEAPDTVTASEATRTMAGEIALDGVIGEELRLETINEVSVVPEFDGFEEARSFAEAAAQLIKRH